MTLPNPNPRKGTPVGLMSSKTRASLGSRFSCAPASSLSLLARRADPRSFASYSLFPL
jgi:hypothetical protein